MHTNEPVGPELPSPELPSPQHPSPELPSPAHAKLERMEEAQHRGLRTWQIVMGVGFALWLVTFLGENLGWVGQDSSKGLIALLQLVTGITIIQGSCEAFVQGVERLGARLRWEGFISGTVGSLVATLPEFVVIAFLVRVEPLAAFVTTVVTIYNNALAFSIYSFFLPKDWRGEFRMPPSLTKAGAEVLIAGSGIAMIVGIIMLVLRAESAKTALAGVDLLLIGGVLITIYAYYLRSLIRYYAEGAEHDDPSHPPDPDELGHDIRWASIARMFLLGAAGAYFGGEAIGGFADIALNELGLPAIATASGLAFFAGISEYIIVFKAHRRGELGIALSNVFGGMTQVLFLLVPFSMIVIAILGAVTGAPTYAIPINTETILLMLLLFPLLYVLLQHIQEGQALSNLDAVAMTAVYALLLYFLFTAPAARP